MFTKIFNWGCDNPDKLVINACVLAVAAWLSIGAVSNIASAVCR